MSRPKRGFRNDASWTSISFGQTFHVGKALLLSRGLLGLSLSHLLQVRGDGALMPQPGHLCVVRREGRGRPGSVANFPAG